MLLDDENAYAVMSKAVNMSVMARPVSASSTSAGLSSASEIVQRRQPPASLADPTLGTGQQDAAVHQSRRHCDQQRDDRKTLRRLVGFGRSWGYDALVVVNLFARISPSPAVLLRCADPGGPEADAALLMWSARWSRTEAWDLWCGWGNGGAVGSAIVRCGGCLSLCYPVDPGGSHGLQVR